MDSFDYQNSKVCLKKYSTTHNYVLSSSAEAHVDETFGTDKPVGLSTIESAYKKPTSRVSSMLASVPPADYTSPFEFDYTVPVVGEDIDRSSRFSALMSTDKYLSSREVKWSQRQVALRHVVGVIFLFLVVLCIAAGAATLLILTQKDSLKSSLSLSSLLTTSSSSLLTTSPSSLLTTSLSSLLTTSPSSLLTTSSPLATSMSSVSFSSTYPTNVTPVTAVLTYSGVFRLKSSWSCSPKDFHESFSQNFGLILAHSLLEDYFHSISFRYFRDNLQEVHFLLNFTPDVITLSNVTSSEELKIFLQYELQKQAKSSNTTSFPIIPETLHLVEYIPNNVSTSSIASSTASFSLSSSSATSKTFTVNSSITDSTDKTFPVDRNFSGVCSPLSFEPCRNLGYRHHYLPNLLQSRTVEQAENDFHYLANNSLANGCTKDPTLFCALAFPPCTPDQPVQTLPCYVVCQETMDACVEFMPFPLYCEDFPTDPPCFSTTITNLTSTPSSTTLPATFCSPHRHPVCSSIGFQVTRFPTWFALDELSSSAMFDRWATPAIESKCHAQIEVFMCSVFYPTCHEDERLVYLPCRTFCQDVQDSCYGNRDELNLDCEFFATSACFGVETSSTTTSTLQPSVYTTPSIDVSSPNMSRVLKSDLCLPIAVEECRHFGFSNGSVPSLWGSRSEVVAVSHFYDFAQSVVSTGCSPDAMFYLCHVIFPGCDGGSLVFPCRSVCQDFNARCVSQPGYFHQECGLLPVKSENSDCVLPPSQIECSNEEFSCEGVPLCISTELVCNRRNDCHDWSDERNCDCHPDFEFRCGMGLCIRHHKLCDNNTDCPDFSDELNCSATCDNGQFRCDDGTCLMPEWLCDGQNDCPWNSSDDFVEEDEDGCGICNKTNQFTCTSGECLPLNHRCDGLLQCGDHSDEQHCMFSALPTIFILGGELAFVCAAGFTDNHADTACRKMGLSGVTQWLEFKDTASYSLYRMFLLSVDGAVSSVLGLGSVVDECPGSLVELDCAPAECGRQLTLGNYITNGDDARLGEVPWQVSIQEYGKHFCGGSLIHPYFVLTAAHCVEQYILNFETMEVVVGTIDLTPPKATNGIFRVKRIIVHPEYVTFQGNDVALVELSEEVSYSGFIQPLCPRQPGDVFTRGSPCYTAGWGKTDPATVTMSTNLQIVKMTLWDTAKCNSSFAWAGQLRGTEICAGYYAGIKAACRGDSGGALFCQDIDYIWRLVGVASYVHLGCNQPEKPVVYTDAGRYTAWINEHTRCRFQCANGRRCLYEDSMVCNKVDDCGDNSDEIDNCDISASCTFDDEFLCGYRSEWVWVSRSWKANRYPLYDHTYGRYPGMFLIGAFRAKSVHAPRIDLSSSHCFRFFYHARHSVKQGFVVFVHELKVGKWVEIWRRENYVGPDMWLLGQFDIGPGNIDIVFMTYDQGVTAIDDTMLLPGTCATQSCRRGEFSCVTYDQWNCLPNGVRCNIVLDCDDGVDEEGCDSPVYDCQFENGLLCGIEQLSNDSASSEWTLVNSSTAGISDVTYDDGTGHMLQLSTKTMLPSDYVYMSQYLKLGGRRHCLAFNIWSTSTVKIQIYLESTDGNIFDVWSVTDRQTSAWSRTQASLPAVDLGYLFYVVIGHNLDRSFFDPMVAIDNLTIIPGVCPPLVCPDGFTTCGGEDFCLENFRICDRSVDCIDASDESVCECIEDEFKCPGGPCIPVQRTCDTFSDCLNGEDEAAICDSLRSVSCTFENPFMCGYVQNISWPTTGSHPYMWSWTKNSQLGHSLHPGTGPIYDHTYGNASGHWAHADRDNGHPFDHVALRSSSFVSDGNTALVFHYTAYSMFWQFWLTGALSLLVRNPASGHEQLLWRVTADGNATWRSACVTVPRGDNVSVVFVAMRGESNSADLAIDDIDLMMGMSCERFYLEPRLQTSPSTIRLDNNVSTSTGCENGEFLCSSGYCIQSTHVCDNITDCVDSLDEKDCETR